MRREAPDLHECAYGLGRSMNELLIEAGLTKAELARRLGLDPHTVSRWGDNPPTYALAYLRLYTGIVRVLNE